MGKATGIMLVCGDDCPENCPCCRRGGRCPGHPTYRRPDGGLRADRRRTYKPPADPNACPLIFQTPARDAAPERARDPRPGLSPAPEQARPDGGA